MNILETALDISFVLVMLGVVFAFARLLKGPSLSDRIVALDMMTVLIVAFCGLFGIFTAVPAFLDVALIVALIGFLATVALARFAERREARRGNGTIPTDPVPTAPAGERH